MAETVLWVGGWASGLACWREALEKLYPGRTHAFLDAHAVLADADLLAATAVALPEGAVLVAWSLGSLLLHRLLADPLRGPALRNGFRGSLVSACPIFEFCREDAPVAPASLARMARLLPRQREEVLSGFWDLMSGDSRPGLEAEEAWFLQAQEYPLPALLAGLEALAHLRADRSALAGWEGRLSFVASPQDPLAPPPRSAAGGRDWLAYPRGHLPFLDYPGLFGPVLEGRIPDPRDA